MNSAEHRTSLIMKTISWLNNTFVPMGMKPLEDLPEALPAQGNSCVIARVLKDNFRDFEAVQVGRTGIDLMPDAYAQSKTPSNLFNPNLAEHLGGDATSQSFTEQAIDVPSFVAMFIQEFDNGKIPDLIDKELAIEYMGECEAYQVLNIGEGCGCNYCEEYGRGTNV